MPPPRTRENQPGKLVQSSATSSLIRSKTHDYIYCPEDWSEEYNTKRYQKGYYDERGKHYDLVVIKHNNYSETNVTCDFCGEQSRLTWKNGEEPVCPKCGASFADLIKKATVEEELKPVEKIITVPYNYKEESVLNKKTEKKYIDDSFLTGGKESLPKYTDHSGVIGACVGIAAVVIFIIGFIAVKHKEDKKYELPRTLSSQEIADYEAYLRDKETADPTPTPVPGYYKKFFPDEYFQDEYYVAELGRSCPYDKSDNYYDAATNCYFWLNKDVDPPIWQYWFEGISSDYGTYGWMEYDYEKQKWYIEVNDGIWIELADKYVEQYGKSRLWHMEYPGDGRYQGMDKVYVIEISRTCKFIEEEHCYYDPDTRCHFYFDASTSPGCWVYWFEDFKETEGIGWLKYDVKEQAWYVENQNRWFKLPTTGVYDFSKYWHIETLQ